MAANWSSSYSAVTERFTGLVAGSEIDIHVNPDRPELCVIIAGAGDRSYYQFLITFVFLGFAVNGLLIHLR